MKFILLYGSPATGKLTVAKELQKLKGYRLLHNHLVVDLIESIDEERSPEFFTLYEDLIAKVLKFAILKDVNLINTFVYGHKIDDNFMKFLKDSIEANGGEVFFIQLVCSQDELLKRVSEPSRKEFGKISEQKKLKEYLEKYDFNTPYKDTDLIIDNTKKSAKEVAKLIIDHIEH